MMILRLWLFLGPFVINSVVSQFNDAMDPREEEYFGARMRYPQNDAVFQEERNRPSLLPMIGGIIGGYFIDRHLGKKQIKKLKYAYEVERKSLEDKLIKYRNGEINKRLIALANLESMVEDAELRIEELQQAAVDAGMDLGETQKNVDYEEFKQPDTNRDDRISKAEFEAYIREYLKQYPHLKKEDMPRFEDFDSSRDGYVTFREWQAYLEKQRQEEAALMAAEEAKKQGYNQYRRA
mmetsp:Transcript_4175/g.6368  ORF Transcript_4175/g.6368 Transcript_4175/m.6368 type:complete len:237 (-) Transcript_4175:11-721(-)